MRETLVVVDRLDSHGDLLAPPQHRTSLTSTATNAAWRGRAPQFSPSILLVDDRSLVLWNAQHDQMV